MLLRDRQRIHNWTLAELARVHKLPERDVRKKIDLLSYGDQYLTERGWAREYSRILDKEYAFVELQKGRKNFESEADRDAFTHLTYIQLDQPDQAGKRLYEVIPEIAENFSKIIQAIDEQIAEPFSPMRPENMADSSKDMQKGENDQLALWGTDTLRDEESKQHITNVLSIIAQSEQHSRIRDITQDVLEASKQEKRQHKNADFCLKQVLDAKKSLMSSYEQLNSEAKLQGIETHLATIEDFVRKIRVWIEENTQK